METIEIDGLVYKIGLRNMVFVRLDDDWVRSTKDRSVIEVAMKNAKKRLQH